MPTVDCNGAHTLRVRDLGLFKYGSLGPPWQHSIRWISLTHFRCASTLLFIAHYVTWLGPRGLPRNTVINVTYEDTRALGYYCIVNSVSRYLQITWITHRHNLSLCSIHKPFVDRQHLRTTFNSAQNLFIKTTEFLSLKPRPHCPKVARMSVARLSNVAAICREYSSVR